MREQKPHMPTSFRLSEEVLMLLRDAAKRERRSQTSMLEVMVLDWCQRNSVHPSRLLTSATKAAEKPDR